MARTYSHIAEPRLVNQAKEIKDWPIKESSETRDADVTVTGGNNLELDLDLDPTNMDTWKVTVNGENIPWDADKHFFLNEDDTIEFWHDDSGYWFWADEDGDYHINIVVEEKVVDPTFAEAVNIVSGGRLPEIDAGDAGKAVIVNEEETGYELGGGAFICEVPADIQAAIMSVMTGALTSAISNGKSYTEVVLTLNDSNIAFVKEIAENMMTGKNVTVIPTANTACKPFTATSITNYYQYALAFIYKYSGYLFQIIIETVAEISTNSLSCNLYVDYLNPGGIQ